MKKVYAAYHKMPNEIENSSSGAIFVALSDSILENSGIIIGGGYNYVNHKVEHVVCQSPEERNACRGSKYIQSHIEGSIYKRLEYELDKSTPLLYVGTPCQIDAVRQYVSVKKLKDDSLITCDILCHGVGSPGIWAKFLEWKKIKIDYLTFKDKRKSWAKPLCIAKSGNKEISLRGYSWLYFSDAIMRPICYECGYASINRVGDFTIGDFWNAKSKAPEMYNPRGTSFIMVNTNKGMRFFDKVKGALVYKEISIDDIIQSNLQHPTYKSSYRNEVMNDFSKKKAAVFFKKWELKLLMDKVKKGCPLSR